MWKMRKDGNSQKIVESVKRKKRISSRVPRICCMSLFPPERLKSWLKQVLQTSQSLELSSYFISHLSFFRAWWWCRHEMAVLYVCSYSEMHLCSVRMVYQESCICTRHTDGKTVSPVQSAKPIWPEIVRVASVLSCRPSTTIPLSGRTFSLLSSREFAQPRSPISTGPVWTGCTTLRNHT